MKRALVVLGVMALTNYYCAEAAEATVYNDTLPATIKVSYKGQSSMWSTTIPSKKYVEMPVNIGDTVTITGFVVDGKNQIPFLSPLTSYIPQGNSPFVIKKTNNGYEVMKYK